MIMDDTLTAPYINFKLHTSKQASNQGEKLQRLCNFFSGSMTGDIGWQLRYEDTLEAVYDFRLIITSNQNDFFFH